MPFHSPAEERIYLSRIDQARTRLRSRYITESVPFNATVAKLGAHQRPLFKDRPKSGYAPIMEGAEWGRDWSTAWFHLTGTVPAAWAGREVVAWIEISGEGLLFDPQGRALQGITHGSIFDQWANSARPTMPLFSSAAGGEQVELWMEGAANQLFGITPPSPELPLDDPKRFGQLIGTITHLRLACIDRVAWSLRLDMDVLIDLLKALPENAVRRARIQRALTLCCDVLARNELDYAAARAQLAGVLAKPANASDIPVRAVGHAHIDSAWLWPLGEGMRKTARTFANQLGLIEQYPGYVFGASAAQHYAWIKDMYPDLYARIKVAVAAGTWELQGGMWVEADCNITGGESLIRQFVHGKNFFRDEFGIAVDNLWIPDVFGYAASLPQIMAKCGVTTFLTQKISWNQFNQFPYNTFYWQGIDGSKILTHFPPEDTYNSELTASSLIGAQGRFKEKDVVDEMMSLFGIGDGGGGPRPEHIERGLRMRNLEGAPPVRFGRACDFFDNLRKAASELRSWSGELYLELHRGTLTTQAYVKKCNRRLELRLRELEMLWSMALPSYPLARLDAIWKEMLTLQFHDIIPGSSINRVYRETNETHDRLLAACDVLQGELAAGLMAADAQAATYFNSLSQTFVGAVRLPDAFAGKGAELDGVAVPCQSEEGATVALVRIPPHGFITLRVAASKPALPAANGLVLENELVRYTFTADGRLASAIDRQLGAELLRSPGNALTLYHDRPCNWDAWDIDTFYRQERIAEVVLAVEPLGSGAVRSRLRLTGKVSNSTITQIVSLEPGSRRLDFRTTVDWHERHRMLRVAFPSCVHTDRAACEIQYGHLYRATHTNTSWDMAKFEVPAHRWVDLSSPDRGIALLNDCKYGYSIHGNSLDLNLLRSPTNPDPEADLGVHHFTYSLMVHPGDLLGSGVLREAGFLNQPPAAFPGRRSPTAAVPVTIDSSDGVELAVVKRAEKSQQLVLRLVETRGMHSQATLRLAEPGRIASCDIMEWTDEQPLASATTHVLRLAPFEIRTLKLL